MHPQRKKYSRSSLSVICMSIIFLSEIMLAFHTLIYCKVYVLSLKAGNNEPIWHGWYPPRTKILDNAGEAWGTSSAIKGSDGFSDQSSSIFLWFFCCFLKNLDWLQSLQRKNRYFEITANLKYLISNFTVYLKRIF